jgi:hypothetical protein
MAIDVDLVPAVTPTVTAAADLRTNQRAFVAITPLGVGLADVRSARPGAIGVLENKPNTSENCTVAFGPNIRKAVAGEAIGLGQHVQVMSATGLAGVLGAHSYAVGIAWQAAAGSGDLFAVKLF